MSSREMMRKIVIRFLPVVVFSMSCSITFAQTWDEWFRQSRTQIRYLVTQIGELKVYAHLLQQGYTVAKDGWQLVGDIKNGEFSLHNQYFTSLKQVNPFITEFAHVAEIAALQASIYKRYRKVWAEAQSCGLFTSSDLQLFQNTFSAFIDDVTHTVDELVRVTSSHKLEMSDDERIKRIELLKANVMQQVADLRTMEKDIRGTANMRVMQQAEIELARRLYAK
ncbi:hypothetical protein [Niastella sp. OAS944]|uniref:hypothetical protein n=1 Tax=Niastella sp. OAS944 TaxID=2664089 RepID=UPI0034898F61|nr:hypothetical protein [Chitinophagaceae bacterium OAS944]